MSNKGKGCAQKVYTLKTHYYKRCCEIGIRKDGGDFTQVRVMGARHSFNEIGDSQEVLVALDHMSEPISFNKQTKSVTIQVTNPKPAIVIFLIF